jgi:uncharacterized protein YoaH (UPF0181 family)
MSAYSVADILEARIRALMALGYSEDDAVVIVIETYRPPRA